MDITIKDHDEGNNLIYIWQNEPEEVGLDYDPEARKGRIFADIKYDDEEVHISQSDARKLIAFLIQATGEKLVYADEDKKIRLEVYQEILEDCKAIYPEYILDYIREQISILINGI